MSMDPLKPVSGLAELLRQRMLGEAGKAGAKGATGARRSKGTAAAPARPELAAIKARVVEAVWALDPEDPGRRSKMLKALVENALTRQFGEQLLNDPRFADLVDNVAVALEGDPAVSVLLGEISSGEGASG